MPPISETHTSNQMLFSTKQPLFRLFERDNPKSNAFTVRRVYFWTRLSRILATFLLLIFTHSSKSSKRLKFFLEFEKENDNE